MGSPISPKVIFQKISAILGTFGDMGTEIKLKMVFKFENFFSIVEGVLRKV